MTGLTFSGDTKMKVKDLVEECKNRPTKKDCEVCPFTERCNFLKVVLSEMSPSEYKTLMDKIYINL